MKLRHLQNLGFSSTPIGAHVDWLQNEPSPLPELSINLPLGSGFPAQPSTIPQAIFPLYLCHELL